MGLGLALAIPAGQATAEPSCSRMQHEGNSYSVCVVDLAVSDLQLFWRDANEQPYRTFRAIDDALAPGAHLSFAMNAGMFDDAYAPVGLFIAGGAELVRANTNEGPGNFHLMPNGVFYWGGGTAGVMETRRFLEERPPAAYATQSGPMLLIEGAIHPRFLVDSDSRKLRNGVGIIDPSHVAFVLTDNSVTFHEFALFFRDALHVRDALFLDGSVSSMYAPQLNRGGSGWFGPILGVVER